MAFKLVLVVCVTQCAGKEPKDKSVRVDEPDIFTHHMHNHPPWFALTLRTDGSSVSEEVAKGKEDIEGVSDDFKVQYAWESVWNPPRLNIEEASHFRQRENQAQSGVLPLPEGLAHRPFRPPPGHDRRPIQSHEVSTEIPISVVEKPEDTIINNQPSPDSEQTISEEVTTEQLPSVMEESQDDYSLSYRTGEYSYVYRSVGGLLNQEQGYSRIDPGSGVPVQVKTGFYHYVGADNRIYRVDYIADEFGYRITTTAI